MLAGILAPLGSSEDPQIRLLDPRLSTLGNWADSLYTDTGIGELPRLDAFASWQEWADRIAAHPEFERRQVPRPDAFDDNWQEWAERVYGIMMS